MSFLITREAMYYIFTDTIDEDLRTWKITLLYAYRDGQSNIEFSGM
jgi:hypothetical protein